MKIFKVYLLNLVLFVVLFVVYYIIGFLLGYGSNGKYEANSWWLYLGFVVFQLFINIIFIAKPKTTLVSHVVGSSIMILILYGIIAYLFR
jgi:hypothetical protein